MKVLVFGAGAVGLGIASALARAGAELALVAREATLIALRRHGLERSGIFGRVRVPPGSLRVGGSIAELAPFDADWIAVATKAFDSEAAARAIAAEDGRLGARAGLVLFQNGWGSAEVFARHFARERIFNARVITGFRRRAPHRVEITVHAEPIRIGSLFGGEPERVEPLCQAIAWGGIPCETSTDIAADLWAKLLYNCALNPLGAIFGVPYGALAESAPGRALLEALVRETFAVMQAAGYRTHWDDPEGYLEAFYRRLLPPTAKHESSTLQDLRAGHRTEIEALTGAVVRLAEGHGVAAPASRCVLEMVRFLEARRSRAAGERST